MQDVYEWSVFGQRVCCCIITAILDEQFCLFEERIELYFLLGLRLLLLHLLLLLFLGVLLDLHFCNWCLHLLDHLSQQLLPSQWDLLPLELDLEHAVGDLADLSLEDGICKGIS